MKTQEELNKDLALITSIIINEDMLGGSVFHTFDKAYQPAKEFQDLNSNDFDWENSSIDFDEAVILFVNIRLLNK